MHILIYYLIGLQELQMFLLDLYVDLRNTSSNTAIIAEEFRIRFPPKTIVREVINDTAMQVNSWE